MNDLNGPLYIVDRDTRTPTVYLNLNGRGAQPGLFHRFTYEAGYANGFVSFRFDPDYAANGKFYTVHIEEPALAASALPDNTNLPSFLTAGYEATAAIPTPGTIQREAVLIAWTDSTPSNATFEGSSREIMRLQLNTRIHPMGEIAFNPTARRGDPDWRVLYIGCGDGGSGEQQTAMRLNPQRLDTMVGKILRIIPDLQAHTDRSSVSENGRYRIPNDNPFASLAGARKEIWAYGLRNPHRLTWDGNTLIAANVGLHAWESVYIVRRGANYGYPLREGHERLNQDNTTTALPEQDRIPVQVTDTDHCRHGGPDVSCPAVRTRQGWGRRHRRRLRLSRGRASGPSRQVCLRRYHDGASLVCRSRQKWSPLTMEARHPGTPARAEESAGTAERYATMFPDRRRRPITRAAGRIRTCRERPRCLRDGRADIRFALDASGELYILSKSDGMIRAVVAFTED